MPRPSANATSGRVEQTRPEWHARDIDTVLADLETDRQGLSDAVAAARLATVGANRLPLAATVSPLVILGNQLRSVVVGLLIAATVLSLIIGDRLEAAAIATVLLINTALGFATEWRARRAMEALLHLEASHALVKRNGRLVAAPAEAIVPGDIVQLDAGNRVPADVRLLTATDLDTDEAPLTGESLPAEKQAAPLPADTTLADRSNMAYLGTTVVSGTALAVVVATGTRTELGRIGTLVNAIEDEPTPLERRLDALGGRLVWLTIGMAGVVAAVAALNGADWSTVLQSGIALAVAAMPEALPAVATIALAVGMRRMARRHALVRRLPSVESLGSATIVCTDKTRTLTTGQMTVVRIWTASGEFRREDTAAGRWPPAATRVLEIAAAGVAAPGARRQRRAPRLEQPGGRALCSKRSPPPIGLALAYGDLPHRGVLPFSSARKMMATFRGSGDDLVAFVKGAPAAVLLRCGGLAHELRAPAARRIDAALAS